MTFGELLQITNRPGLDPDEYPFTPLFYGILSDINPYDLVLAFVDSDAARTSIETFDGETYLVWDARYHTQIAELLSIALLAPVPDSLTMTESIVVKYLVDFCQDRGRSDVGNRIAGHRGINWEYLIKPEKRTGFAAKVLTELEEQVDENNRLPNFETFAEAESFLQSMVPFGAAEIEPVLNIQLTTMAAFIFAHELGHYVLSYDQERLERYEGLSRDLLDEEKFEACYWPEDHLTLLPLGVSLAYHDAGKPTYADTFFTKEQAGQVTAGICRQQFMESAAIREEVYCDWFAIDWLIAALVPRDASQLQFAEIEQALWLCHQYKKYFSLFRHDLLGHMEGVTESSASILSEYQARGLLQHVRLRQLMHEPDRNAPIQAIFNHREAIRWMDLLFLERQEKVLSRFAHNFHDFLAQLNP